MSVLGIDNGGKQIDRLARPIGEARSTELDADLQEVSLPKTHAARRHRLATRWRRKPIPKSSDMLEIPVPTEAGMIMSTTSLKQTAHQIIDDLPDDANWKDLIYELSVLQDIEEGLSDSEAGRTIDNATVREQFGLSE
jgi:hypothetical protein